MITSQAHRVPSPDGKRFLFASDWLFRDDGAGAIQDCLIDARSLRA